MPNRYPTTRSRFGWASALVALAAAWIGAQSARAWLRRRPGGIGDFDGLHLER